MYQKSTSIDFTGKASQCYSILAVICPTWMAWVSKGWSQSGSPGDFVKIATHQTGHLSWKKSRCSTTWIFPHWNRAMEESLELKIFVVVFAFVSAEKWIQCTQKSPRLCNLNHSNLPLKQFVSNQILVKNDRKNV